MDEASVYKQKLRDYVKMYKEVIYTELDSFSDKDLPEYIELFPSYGEEAHTCNNIKLNKCDLLFRRRSSRVFNKYKINVCEIYNIIYNAYGIREYEKEAYRIKNFPLRTSPTSGGLQCIDLFIFVNYSQDLDKSILYYNLITSSLEIVSDLYDPYIFYNICIGNEFVVNASIIVALVADLSKIFWKYKTLSLKLAFLDSGFVGENLYLASTYLNFKVCAVGGFDINYMSEVLDLEEWQIPTLLVAIGK